MASIITATTSSGLTQSADNSGVLQLASGSGNLVTVPSVTGTAMVSGNMPAFLAYPSAATATLTSSVWTKVACNTEVFDTNNCFDSTTNYRFTPNVAGYYQLNAFVYESGFAGSLYFLALRKNGTNIQELYRTTVTGQATFNGSTIVYANGSTDYFELYTYSSGGTMTLGANDSRYMNFSGSMIRSA
jgi:hypothetical protein